MDSEQFEDWWTRSGQFGRAGGGQYEKTFAFNAWNAALATEVASPVVGTADPLKLVEKIKHHHTECSDQAWHAGNSSEQVGTPYYETLRLFDAALDQLAALATPSQQEDAQPVAEVRGDGVSLWTVWLDAKKSATPPGTLLYTRAAPPARSSVPQWQPIETAPKNGTDVLLWREDCGQFIGCYATPDFFVLTQEQLDALSEEELSSHDWFTQWPDARRLDGPELPTHWMPLPDAPASPQSPQAETGEPT